MSSSAQPSAPPGSPSGTRRGDDDDRRLIASDNGRPGHLRSSASVSTGDRRSRRLCQRYSAYQAPARTTTVITEPRSPSTRARERFIAANERAASLPSKPKRACGRARRSRRRGARHNQKAPGASIALVALVGHLRRLLRGRAHRSASFGECALFGFEDHGTLELLLLVRNVCGRQKGSTSFSSL